MTRDLGMLDRGDIEALTPIGGNVRQNAYAALMAKYRGPDGVARMRRDLEDIMRRRDVRETLAGAGYARDAELTLRVVNEAEGAALNETYRHKQGPTNVLSFPFAAPPQVESALLGDIVISLPDGMTVETVPAARTESRDGFDFSLACAVENGTALHVRRDIAIKKCDFSKFYYGDVRAFFDRVRAADEEQVVLAGAKK